MGIVQNLMPVFVGHVGANEVGLGTEDLAHAIAVVRFNGLGELVHSEGFGWHHLAHLQISRIERRSPIAIQSAY